MGVEPVLDLEDQRAAAFAAHRAHRERRPLPPVSLHERTYPRVALALGDEVDLVQHEPARLLGERDVVALQLVDDHLRVADRIGVRIERRDVDDVQQHARALQVTQELVTESRAVGRAFDESRDVGDDEAPVLVGAHDAEVRRERRERVVGDLRACRGHRADERALAGVRHAEETDVGEDPELEAQPALLALAPGRELARRAVRAGLEVQIAETAGATLCDQRPLAVGREIGDGLAGVGVGDHRADRHAQHDVLGSVSVLICAATVLAALRAVDACVAIVDQRVDVAVGDRPDAAAASAVATVGPASGHELLPPEARGAIAAVAGDDLDHGLVDESHGDFRR